MRVMGTTAVETPNGSLAARRRRIQAIAAICTLFLTAGCIFCGSVYVKSHSRRRFVASVDPISGKGIEFTVSARYRMSASNASFTNIRTFVPQSGYTVYDWIDARILHRKKLPPRPSAARITLDTETWVLKKGDFLRMDPGGYVTIDPVMLKGVVSLERLMLSGEPATFTVVDIAQSEPNSNGVSLRRGDLWAGSICADASRQ